MQEHPNAVAARAGLEAFVAGDLETLVGLFADDLVWHAPGTNRFSGKFVGKQEWLERTGRMREAGIELTFDVHDVVANDEHVVALVEVHLENAARQRYDGPQVQVMHVRDGIVREFWGMNQDQAAADLIMGS
jgi:ketosteroid isomerase-like protein